MKSSSNGPKRGDDDAYEELVRAYQGIAFRTAYLVAGNAADAEDAAQEGFVKAHRALGTVSPRRAVSALAAPDRRQRGPEPPPLGGPSQPVWPCARPLKDPRGARLRPPRGLCSRARSRERLLAAVNELREEERLVIACRYFLELSEEETAAALGVRIGTVKSRTSRALDQLRETYA